MSGRLGPVSGSKSVAVADVIKRLNVANSLMTFRLFKRQDHKKPLQPGREAETMREQEKHNRQKQQERDSKRKNQGDGETNADGLLTHSSGNVSSDVMPDKGDATWMHHDNLEGINIEIHESVIFTLKAAAQLEF